MGCNFSDVQILDGQAQDIPSGLQEPVCQASVALFVDVTLQFRRERSGIKQVQSRCPGLHAPVSFPGMGTGKCCLGLGDLLLISISSLCCFLAQCHSCVQVSHKSFLLRIYVQRFSSVLILRFCLGY